MSASRKRALAVVLALVVGFGATACADSAEESEREPAAEPAKVDEAIGDAPPHIHLTAEAVKRLDIKTAQVKDAAVAPRPTGVTSAAPAATAAGAPAAGEKDAGGRPKPAVPTPAPAAAGPSVRRVVPFAAVLYEASGEAFTYTNPAPLEYVRAKVVIDYVVSDLAVLTDGPPAGTNVVIVGGAELLGAELGVGE